MPLEVAEEFKCKTKISFRNPSMKTAKRIFFIFAKTIFMSAILVQTKNENDLQFISSLLKRMKVKTKVMDDEELEDLGLSVLIRDVDRTKKISEESVLRKLRK